MRHYFDLRIKFILIIILFFSCEDNEKNISSDEETGPISITTSNVNVTDFYFNLDNQAEVEESSSWHVAIKTEGDYNMPSIFFNDNMNVAVYENIVFEDLLALPETFNSDIQIDHSIFRYEGFYEILSYNIEIHKVGVTNPDYVYLLKEDQVNKSFKIQFIEYISGVTVFQYAEL